MSEPSFSSDDLRTAIDQAGQPILIADTLGRVTYANEAFADLARLSQRRIQGRHFTTILGAGTDIDVSLIGERLVAGQDWHGQVRARRHDGSSAQLDVVISSVQDRDGTPTHAIVLIRDLSRESELTDVLSGELRQQAAIGAVLAGLDPSEPVATLAGEVARALLALDGVDGSRVIALGSREQAEVLATRTRDVEAPRQRMVPAARTRHLRTRAAEGAWVEAWVARREYGRYGRDLKAAGIRAAGFAPIRHSGRPVGLLAVYTVDPRGIVVLERHLTALSHVGTLASGLLGPALAAHQQDADLRAVIQRAIDGGQFAPVFQPIVRLGDREPIAYEALTRFDDGTPPERRFADADVAGLGLELEIATLRAALDAASTLPPHAILSVNVSPRLVMDNGHLRAVLAEAAPDRPMMLEVTEGEPIDDYDAFRTAVAGLEVAADWAVDDAGAGYASLRHIIELQPGFVKLDRGLVDGINADPVRQALVTGMLHFAELVGVRLIAEGVETERDLLTLKALGVELGQGYLFGRPAVAGGSAQAIG